MRKLFTIKILMLGMFCYGQNYNVDSNNSKLNANYISIHNFPSKDTSTVVFEKKNKKWFQTIIYKKGNTLERKQIECIQCDKLFTNHFFKSLNEIKREDTNSKNCTVYKYVSALNDSIKVFSIDNFYNISDLQEETLTFKFKKRIRTIKYIEPRLAVSYCKENIDRLKFIAAVDFLRKIK